MSEQIKWKSFNFKKPDEFFLRQGFGLVLFFFLQVLSQPWVRQNPLPVGPSNQVFNVIAVGTQSAYILSQSENMAFTGNGGDSWSMLYPGKSVDLMAASFLDSLNGWVVGDSGFIAQTKDGGASWHIQNSKTSCMLEDVQFIDSMIGYAVGDTGTILKTTNGGADWRMLKAPTNGNYLSVCFINADTGWVSGNNVIARTNDGGSTWIIQSPINSIYRSIYFKDKDTGWVGEFFGTIYKTTNGGEKWNVLYSFPDPDMFWLYDLYFLNNQTAWAVGAFQISGTNNDGRIMVTFDGGVTWSRQAQTEQPLLKIAFNDINRGWAVGINGTIIKTTDGGINWKNAVIGPTNVLNDVFFINKNLGWAVGGSSWDSSLILHTKNGGKTWISQETPVKNVGLKDVFFLDSLKGFAVGQSQTILKTTDGGFSWTGQSEGGIDLQQIFFIDTANGWVVGGNSLQSAFIKKTTDGGSSWQAVTLPTTAPLNDVYFINKDTGWIVGYKGTVLRTFNAGLSFTNLSDSSLGTLINVRFFNSSLGIVAGSNGIFKTINGGTTWAQILSVSTNLGAFFLDSLTFYMITGSNSTPFPGFIYRTINGGISWQKQFLQNGMFLNGGIYFHDSNTGWVVSGGGTILYTSNAGSTNWTGIKESNSPIFKGNYKKPNGEIQVLPMAKGFRIFIENVHSHTIELSIFNSFGRLIWSQRKNIEQNDNFSFFWYAAAIPGGIYFIKARQKDRFWYGRIFVLK